MRQINIGNVHEFASDAIDTASRIELDPNRHRSFGLPDLNVEVRSTDRKYIDLCETAFADQPASRSANERKITVSVVNRKSSESLPSALWDEPEFSIRRMADTLQSNGFEGVFEFDYRLWQFLRADDGACIQLMQTADAYPPWEAAFPLRQFVHWAYQRSDMLLAHAGTLGLNGSGILLAGAGGAGKSGTVLAGILNRLQTCGDDYVVVGRSGETWTARPVVRLMKQDADGLARAGLDTGSGDFGDVNWQNKYVFDYDALVPGSAAVSLNLRAILIPCIAHAPRTELRPANGREALLALAPSSLYQLKGGWTNTMKMSAEICRHLPAYHVELGGNPREISETISEFMERLSA
ncbi:serine kinase [Hoeflea poritis]|uniref:Serine kinase n=1 Tax=Hoeflea poritis TaxID=2993659 RepID=A0ABT4VH99_9HYPH|nr:serine kinase [Hoeflea poritis]MDA4844056.1 serine kinase [Hoeflea poritis]